MLAREVPDCNWSYACWLSMKRTKESQDNWTRANQLCFGASSLALILHTVYKVINLTKKRRDKTNSYLISWQELKYVEGRNAESRDNQRLDYRLLRIRTDSDPPAPPGAIEEIPELDIIKPETIWWHPKNPKENGYIENKYYVSVPKTTGFYQGILNITRGEFNYTGNPRIFKLWFFSWIANQKLAVDFCSLIKLKNSLKIE